MIELTYWNENLQPRLADWKTVYRFPQKELMEKEIHQGNLYYRSRGSSRRISYNQIKKGLIKKQIFIKEELFILPF